jgi:2,3-bisphosphoglycerate-dependent phosphoglycerate mutase
VLLRHGESTWNAQRRFTGWGDPPLTERGHVEGREAGDALVIERLFPDLLFTSVLARAEQTVAGVLTALAVRPGIVRDWRLNERHYGALEGMQHDDARNRYGAEVVDHWRRSWDAKPPPLPTGDPRHPVQQSQYADIPPEVLPDSESLATCLQRQLPCITGEVTPSVLAGAQVLLIGHGNTPRALVAHLEHIPPEAVPRLLIPTGVPLLYHHHDGWKRDTTTFAVHGTWTGP